MNASSAISLDWVGQEIFHIKGQISSHHKYLILLFSYFYYNQDADAGISSEVRNDLVHAIMDRIAASLNQYLSKQTRNI